LAPDGSGHSFGELVDLDGENMAVAARGWGPSRGAIYTYRQDASGAWELDAILSAPTNVGTFSDFGRSMDLNGQMLIVGAAAARKAVVYQRIAGQWIQQTQFASPNSPRYGEAVAIEGDIAAVAGDTGGLQVFHRTAGVWSLDATLLPVGNDSFTALDQKNIAIDGGRIIVGAEQLNSGGIYVFEKVAGAWTHTALLQSGVGGTTNANWSVDIEGDWLLGGADIEPPGTGGSQGAAYLWHHSSSGWDLKYKLLGSDLIGFPGSLGFSVDLDGTDIAVGRRQFTNYPDGYSPGVYLFQVPEPSSMALAALGAVITFAQFWRKRRTPT
jgi:hypothetical protein